MAGSAQVIKNQLFALFAISPIVRRFALPGVLGFLLFAVGLWQQLDWLKLTGVILAAPISLKKTK